MIKEFERHLRETNLSENTISSYLFAARQFCEYVAVVEHPGAQRLNTRGAEIVQLRRQGCTLTA